MSKENVGLNEPSGIEIPGLDLTGLPSIETKTPEEIAAEEAERQKADAAAAAAEEEKKKNQPPPNTPPAPTGNEVNEVEEEVEDEGSLIADVAKRVGYEFEENEEYDETEEGLANFVSTLVDKQSNAKLNEFLDSLPPVAGEFFDFLSMGGNPEDFFSKATPEIDYKKVDLTQPDVQKSVLRTMYRKLEYENADIDAMIEDMVLVDGMLEKQAKMAAAKLQVIQEKERQQLVREQEEKQKADQKKINDYWAEVQKTIESSRVKGFEISKAEQKELFAYMSKPVKNGLSQFAIDSQQLSVEDRILYAKMVKNKFNLDGFVKAATATNNARNLRDKIGGAGRRMRSGEDRTPSAGSSLDIGLHNIGK